MYDTLYHSLYKKGEKTEKQKYWSIPGITDFNLLGDEVKSFTK